MAKNSPHNFFQPHRAELQRRPGCLTCDALNKSPTIIMRPSRVGIMLDRRMLRQRLCRGDSGVNSPFPPLLPHTPHLLRTGRRLRLPRNSFPANYYLELLTRQLRNQAVVLLSAQTRIKSWRWSKKKVISLGLPPESRSLQTFGTVQDQFYRVCNAVFR